MSTGEKLIRASQWQPLDGSASNAIPKWTVVAGSQTQKLQLPVVAFDGAGSTVQYACYTTRVPVDYASGGNLKFLWMANTTSGSVKWQGQVGAITPADSDTPLEHAWSTAATVTPSVDSGEARRLVESTMTLNMDSAAAGDLLSFLISRDPANDTCTSDAELLSCAFTYTANDTAGSPTGFLGAASITADQSGIGTSPTDVTGVSVSFSADNARRYKASIQLHADTSANGNIARFTLTDNSNTVLQIFDVPVATSGISASESGFVYLSGLSTGTYVVKLRAERLSTVGSGTIVARAGATFPITLLVEDIGT